MSDRGFTLFEMVTTLLILAITAAVAVPNLSSLYNSAHKLSARQMLAADLLASRNDAVARGTRVVVSLEADGDSYSVGFDSIPYTNPPKPDAANYVRLLPAGITVGPQQELVFDSRGYLVDQTGKLTTANLVFSYKDLAYTLAAVLPTGDIEFQ